MPRIALRSSLLAAMLLFGAALACAQQGQPGTSSQATQIRRTGQQPNANGASSQQPPTSQGYSSAQQGTATTTASTTPSTAQPLTGAEQFTLSRMGTGRSYFIPSFQYGQSFIASGTSTFPSSQWDLISSIGGDIAFHHVWRRYDFTAQYSGTGMIYPKQPELNTSAHNFSISQRIQGKRSSFLLTDVVMYLPESRYGYARFASLGTFGGTTYGYGGLYTGSTGGLNAPFLPGQSILSSPSSRVGNSVVAQYNFLTSPISSVTLTGSYVSLFFPGSQYINTSDAIVRFGYDRSLSPKNSLGLSYQAAIYRFGTLGGNFTNHDVSLIYRRTVTHRFGFEVGAGPQVNLFNNTAANQNLQLSWQANATLEYQLEHFTTDITYFHYTSGGSGVYYGARTDDVALQTSIPLSRMWTTAFSLGYAYNTTLPGQQSSGTASSFNTWYGTFNLNYNLNRQMNLFMSYNLRQQMTSQATCVGPACGTFYAQQYVSFGINWHPIVGGME